MSTPLPDILPDILPLKPYLREVVWGGRRLGERFDKDLPPGVPIGESYEVSALPGEESVVGTGPLAGCGLGELVTDFGEALVGAAVRARYGDAFPLLIKLIDAQDDLSIQVHPGDGYARDEGLGQFGKTEAWYVLHADNARMALGLHPGTDESALRAALVSGQVEDAVLYRPVAVDEVIFLPAGTVHALCRGVMVYEVQQASDITFRLYDYGRLGLDGQPRELHIDRGVAVTDFDGPVPRPQKAPLPAPGGSGLIEADEFSLTLHGEETDLLTTAAAFAAVTVLDGGARFADAELGPGGSALIPAGRRVPVTATRAGLRYLVAEPGC